MQETKVSGNFPIFSLLNEQENGPLVDKYGDASIQTLINPVGTHLELLK